MSESADRAARQRSFYLKLSPQGGAFLSTALNGAANPGHDSIEAELKDSMSLWFKIHASDAFDTVMDTAWWMTRYQDRYGRMSRQEANTRCDELATYAVATIGMLMEQGVLQFVKEPEIPTLITSGYDEESDAAAKAIFDFLESGRPKEDPSE